MPISDFDILSLCNGLAVEQPDDPADSEDQHVDNDELAEPGAKRHRGGFVPPAPEPLEEDSSDPARRSMRPIGFLGWLLATAEEVLGKKSLRRSARCA